MKWPPPRTGNRDVRKAKPLISPLTFGRPPIPQALRTSNGTSAITQPRTLLSRTSVALKDLATGFLATGLGITLEANKLYACPRCEARTSGSPAGLHL